MIILVCRHYGVAMLYEPETQSGQTILDAIEREAPGITKRTYLGQPRWVDRVFEASEVWFDGLDIERVEVAVQMNSFDVERLVVSVIAGEVVAQCRIVLEPNRDDRLGRFEEWTIGSVADIVDLSWERQGSAHLRTDQISARFSSLPEPIAIPSNRNSFYIEPAVAARLFRRFRDAWATSHTARTVDP